MSLLQNILDILPEGTQLPLKTKHDSSICHIGEVNSFVRPPLYPDKADLKNIPIIIISAPGAVGKSTLAKFIAFEKKQFYRI